MALPCVKVKRNEAVGGYSECVKRKNRMRHEFFDGVLAGTYDSSCYHLTTFFFSPLGAAHID